MHDQLTVDKVAPEKYRPLLVIHFESHDALNVHGLLAAGVSIAYH
jgi:hypothetical protein